MSTTRYLVQDSNGFQRAALPGDTVITNDLVGSLTTAGAGTILGAMFGNTILERTGPSGAFTDTTDTADNIINALIAPAFVGTGGGIAPGLQPGTTFRFIYRNTVAQAMTLAAGTGVTLGSNVNVSASSVREYLITILNGTRRQVFTANTTNASTAVTGLLESQLNQLSVGMLVTGTGISANTTIAAITATGITLSANATATGSPVLTFSPRLSIAGISQAAL